MEHLRSPSLIRQSIDGTVLGITGFDPNPVPVNDSPTKETGKRKASDSPDRTGKTRRKLSQSSVQLEVLAEAATEVMILKNVVIKPRNLMILLGENDIEVGAFVFSCRFSAPLGDWSVSQVNAAFIYHCVGALTKTRFSASAREVNTTPTSLEGGAIDVLCRADLAKDIALMKYWSHEGRFIALSVVLRNSRTNRVHVTNQSIETLENLPIVELPSANLKPSSP